jgi:hypothetical protein
MSRAVVQAEMLTSEGLEKARSVLTSEALKGLSVLKGAERRAESRRL